MKRSREQIMEEIMVICKEPAGVTKIVYQCNLNFYTVRIHIERLTGAGLLDVSETDPILYKTTSFGVKALEHINAFRVLLMPATKSQKDPVLAEGF
ncbi:MAG: winged helix-turn-helix domain-containing protein [Methanothrix sp.]